MTGSLRSARGQRRAEAATRPGTLATGTRKKVYPSPRLYRVKRASHVVAPGERGVNAHATGGAWSCCERISARGGRTATKRVDGDATRALVGGESRPSPRPPTRGARQQPPWKACKATQARRERGARGAWLWRSQLQVCKERPLIGRTKNLPRWTARFLISDMRPPIVIDSPHTRPAIVMEKHEARQGPTPSILASARAILALTRAGGGGGVAGYT